MTNLPTPPLTPQQKLEYLCAKLETTIAEVLAVTGLPLKVSIDIFDHEITSERLSQLITAAKTLGFEDREWSNETQGGWWDYRLAYGCINLHDETMQHQPADLLEDRTDGGMVYFADRHDVEVLGTEMAEAITRSAQ